MAGSTWYARPAMRYPAPYPGDDRIREIFNLLERTIEDRCEIPVVIRDVPAPFTGDLGGAEIAIDYANDVEEALFILAHLFGHTVQWNTDPDAREIPDFRPTRWLARSDGIVV